MEFSRSQQCRTHRHSLLRGPSSPQPGTRSLRARLQRTILRRHRSTPRALVCGIDPCATPPALRPLPNAPSRRPRRSQRKTSAQSATESCRHAPSRTSSPSGSRTSTAASLLIAPTGVGQQQARPTWARKGRRPTRRRPRGGRGSSRTWRRRRTAWTPPSARSAWRSSRLGWRWRGWSVSAGFTTGAYRRGS